MCGSADTGATVTGVTFGYQVITKTVLTRRLFGSPGIGTIRPEVGCGLLATGNRKPSSRVKPDEAVSGGDLSAPLLLILSLKPGLEALTPSSIRQRLPKRLVASHRSRLQM